MRPPSCASNQAELSGSHEAPCLVDHGLEKIGLGFTWAGLRLNPLALQSLRAWLALSAMGLP